MRGMMRQLHAYVATQQVVVAAAAATALLILAGGGCGPRAAVDLYQPRATGQQQLVQLNSAWAHFATGDGLGDRLLLSWPLPGSRAGREQYHLYLQVERADGTFSAGKAATTDDIVCGFLIQRSGRLAGLAGLSGGTLTVSGNDAVRVGELDLECVDGARIRGSFRATREDLTVEFFEEDHAADLALLEPAGEVDRAMAGAAQPAPPARPSKSESGG